MSVTQFLAVGNIALQKTLYKPGRGTAGWKGEWEGNVQLHAHPNGISYASTPNQHQAQKPTHQGDASATKNSILGWALFLGNVQLHPMIDNRFGFCGFLCLVPMI